MIDNAAARDAWVNGAIPSQRTPSDATPLWAEDATMVLPAFVAGGVEPAVADAIEAVTDAYAVWSPASVAPPTSPPVLPRLSPRGGARHRAEATDETPVVASGQVAPAPTPVATPDRDLADRLPSSERNMLIFVAMLLALGTIAVVATMGIGKFG